MSVRDLWAGYDGNAVLEAVNLEIDRGDMVGIIGPNGSGKSTLIKTPFGIKKTNKRRNFYSRSKGGSLERHLVGYIPRRS
ncbi:MAG: hypothetical protein Ct9H300mP11_32200 [Chloroflexota bacterium]|nr:MAG: hypothetical protein Ct9H300mP11_32200 [Chloroflexota bacterium]